MNLQKVSSPWNIINHNAFTSKQALNRRAELLEPLVDQSNAQTQRKWLLILQMIVLTVIAGQDVSTAKYKSTTVATQRQDMPTRGARKYIYIFLFFNIFYGGHKTVTSTPLRRHIWKYAGEVSDLLRNYRACYPAISYLIVSECNKQLLTDDEKDLTLQLYCCSAAERLQTIFNVFLFATKGKGNKYKEEWQK